ncbi:AraC family transcriptional regulator [Allomuricauda sp. SCSIO 65647]|uniref:helix-turn-helix domain-containing protein n=1 Tax=Allomuricauda sp. SCSIO 65647 TaxID=2908843 RepID=UPI001F1ABECD|nr:helix-turn-helix domain-containing protein [Muricauda sp. SCSIO 65647]UJH66091.1 helix-turn-helix domain-containing protein [Muricauda sp. SCSIO 65647]
MKTFQSIDDFLCEIGIKSFQENKDFFIFRIEDHFGDNDFEMSTYKHSFFELTFGIGHDVDINIGTTKFNTVENVLSFNTPYQITSWKVNSFEENSIGYMVLFNPNIIKSEYSNLDLYTTFPFLNLYSSPMHSLSESQKHALIKLMQTIHTEFNQNSGGRKSIILSSYLTILLEKINSIVDSSTTKKIFTNRADEITYLFENLLKKDINYKNKLAYYASKLFISTAYLSECVKKSTQKSAKALIQEFIIFKAKALLNQSNSKIQNVAIELGFVETSNFVNYFKKQVGITPNKYRKNHNIYNLYLKYYK